MLKASELKGSAWDGKDGDMMVVEKEGSKWVASGNSYQIINKSATKLQQELKKDGFRFVGYE